MVLTARTESRRKQIAEDAFMMGLQRSIRSSHRRWVLKGNGGVADTSTLERTDVLHAAYLCHSDMEQSPRSTVDGKLCLQRESGAFEAWTGEGGGYSVVISAGQQVARYQLAKVCGLSPAYISCSIVVARMRPQLLMSVLTLVNAAVSFRKQGGHLRAASVTVCDASHVISHDSKGATNRLCLLPAMSTVRSLHAAKLCPSHEQAYGIAVSVLHHMGTLVRLAGVT